MNILGAHLGHDGSCSVVKDGKLVAAISRERITRARKTHGICQQTIEYVLRVAGLTIHQIDAVALSDYHSQYCHGAIEVRKKEGFAYPGPIDLTPEGLVLDTWNRVWADDPVWEFDVTIMGRVLPGYNVGHHLSHCAAAYYTSPFEESFCVSMDSSGGEIKTNFILCHGEGNQLTAIDVPYCHVGLAYGFFCEWLGLGSQMFKAGSMMALASYGKLLPGLDTPRHVRDSFIVQGKGVHYRTWVERLWNDLADGPQHFSPEQSDKERAMDIAASMQHIFEESILECVSRIENRSVRTYSNERIDEMLGVSAHTFVNTRVEKEVTNLCLGGGSFLNCTVNSRILRESKFKNIHLFPACSDDGLAVGCALYVAHAIFNEPRHKYTDAEISYLGQDYEQTEEPNLKVIAKELSEGKVVAWCHGKSEYGPRALGHRSLLADPRYGARNHINENLKHREWFRPVCPSVIAESASDWFDHPTKSPFMLFTAQAKNKEQIPSAVHVDGSARMQTVERETNPMFYDLLTEFKAITGIPMLINTSLNRAGEPIIETEEEAMDLWNHMAVDLLVVNGKLIRR